MPEIPRGGTLPFPPNPIIQPRVSAFSQGSGPRENAYSGSKFSNWSEYRPHMMEATSVLKRFDRRIAKHPPFPAVIAIQPISGFRHACTTHEVTMTLREMRPELLADLRAVFLLGGTRKQERSQGSKICYGMYFNRTVFLCATIFGSGYYYLDHLRNFYLRDVLPHEVAHHHDRIHRSSQEDDRENYVNAFVERGDAWMRKR
jgi:hypothetical protein